MDRRGAPWTPDEESALVAAFEKGADVAELARTHGRTANAVVTRLVVLNKLVGLGRAYYRVGERYVTWKTVKGLDMEEMLDSPQRNQGKETEK